MAKLGIQMIEMYCGMIDEEFRPMMQQISESEANYKMSIRHEVEEELGIRKVMIDIKKKEAEVADLQRQVRGFENSMIRTLPDGRRLYLNELEYRTELRMLADQEGRPSDVIQRQVQELKKKVKLAGISTDMERLFMEELPKVLASTSEAIQKMLPKPKEALEGGK